MRAYVCACVANPIDVVFPILFPSRKLGVSETIRAQPCSVRMTHPKMRLQRRTACLARGGSASRTARSKWVPRCEVAPFAANLRDKADRERVSKNIGQAQGRARGHLQITSGSRTHECCMHDVRTLHKDAYTGPCAKTREAHTQMQPTRVHLHMHAKRCIQNVS